MSEEREVLEVDVLVIGGGAAGLSAAITAAKGLAEAGNDEAMVLLLEKGKEIGHHILSGCVMDPRGLAELFPDYRERGAPIEAECTSESVYVMAPGFKVPIPAPPPMHNKGNLIVSAGELCRWLAGQAEEAGVEVFPEFPASELIFETVDGEERVVGVRTGDKGIGKDGAKQSNYEPGMEVRAPVTILAEGSRGSCTKVLVEKLDLHGHHPQSYATGAKEIWRLPKGHFAKGRVVHTMGYPLDLHTFGGSFIYGMDDETISLGFVVGLDYLNPTVDAHRMLQDFKTHPYLQELLKDGELVCYGAKTIPEGGLYAMPRLYAGGVMLAGDSGGFLNSARLKGVHLAIKSGMMAGETAVEAVQAKDVSAAKLSAYDDRFRASWAHTELRKVRNFHQGFRGGLFAGMFHAATQQITGGRGLWLDPMPSGPDHERMLTKEQYAARFGHKPKVEEERFDGVVTFSKMDDIYASGTKHEEDQPVHLLVADTDLCLTKCTVEYGNPCEEFCPAAVYEMVASEAGDRRLQINASNCVHCKTCDIMDPYAQITWVTPEGGGGPRYTRM
jgi:electron-transferring-flavoprotein dehydrogenase